MASGSGPVGPRRRAAKWTDERLQAALEDFLGDRQDWPRQAEFEAAGHGALWMAVYNHGGTAHWAERLGRQLDARQRMHEPASEEELLVLARSLVDQLGRLPGEDALRALGHGRLATAVKYAGGARKYRLKHGL